MPLFSTLFFRNWWFLKCYFHPSSHLHRFIQVITRTLWFCSDISWKWCWKSLFYRLFLSSSKFRLLVTRFNIFRGWNNNFTSNIQKIMIRRGRITFFLFILQFNHWIGKKLFFWLTIITSSLKWLISFIFPRYTV